MPGSPPSAHCSAQLPAPICSPRKLKRCLYESKQSPREWYSKLTTYLLPYGFVLSSFDPCVLIHDAGNLYAEWGGGHIRTGPVHTQSEATGLEVIKAGGQTTKPG
jgi:hypothetical protein